MSVVAMIESFVNFTDDLWKKERQICVKKDTIGRSVKSILSLRTLSTLVSFTRFSSEALYDSSGCGII